MVERNYKTHQYRYLHNFLDICVARGKFEKLNMLALRWNKRSKGCLSKDSMGDKWNYAANAAIYRDFAVKEHLSENIDLAKQYEKMSEYYVDCMVDEPLVMIMAKEEQGKISWKLLI